ncbi:unnamed protein product [Calypogeia fissa]
MDPIAASATTTRGTPRLKYFLHENCDERDCVHLLQNGRMTKSARCLSSRCLPWESFTGCGKEVSYSFRKFVESGKSKLKKKQGYIFAPQVNLSTAALTRHGAGRSLKEADLIASIATAPKSILYYA